jgi:hypothetical protein
MKFFRGNTHFFTNSAVMITPGPQLVIYKARQHDISYHGQEDYRLAWKPA